MFWEGADEEDVDTNPIAGYLEMSMPAEFVDFMRRLMNQGTSSSWSEWAWRPWGPECDNRSHSHHIRMLDGMIGNVFGKAEISWHNKVG